MRAGRQVNNNVIDIMEQMRDAFRAEALDLLIELDSALLALEAAPGDSTSGTPGVPRHSHHQGIGSNRRFRASCQVRSQDGRGL